MRYLIPGVNFEDYPNCVPERLRRICGWSAQGDPQGALLTAKDWPAGEYASEPRKTPEGWLYWPQIKPPSLHQLFRPKTIVEACQSVDLMCGQRVLIRPAYMEPHRIFSTGEMGDPITEYGRRARRVGDLLRADDPLGIRHPEALLLWLEAVGITYRATAEIIDDIGIFSLEDVDCIIEAVFAGPKLQPGAGISPSPSPG